MAVCIAYEQLRKLAAGEVSLQESGLDSKIQAGFGAAPDCLGIIIVEDLPHEFAEQRRRLLTLASRLAHLSDAELQRLEDPSTNFLRGWSRGKERLGRTGREDVQKGSFYANPVSDGDSSRSDFPEYTGSNIWPDSIPGFQEAFETLGSFIVRVGTLVAKACDESTRLHSNNLYAENFLETMIKTSKTVKARLLHYYPMSETSVSADGEDDSDTWCGEHLDHGCLTGLTSALFMEETGDEMRELEKSPDPRAGLYIRDRSGRSVKVAIPADCLAFQTGEALQIVTAGKLRAVPHYVRGCEVPNVARNTLAVFMQPNLDDQLGHSGHTFAEFAQGVVKANYT